MPPKKAAAKSSGVTWQWAGDSKKGSQDVWIDYDDAVAKKLEAAHQRKAKTFKLDAERYVDLVEMLQRRYDDPSKRRTVKRIAAEGGDESESDDDEDTGTVKWVWAGDSKKGSQDVWIDFDAAMTKKLEAAYNKGTKKVKVDSERYVDLEDHDNMLQRRYDDPTKRRTVERRDGSAGGAKRKAGAAGGAAKKAKGGASSSSSGLVDIVFSFDTTGSMMSYLKEVRKTLSDTITRLLRDIPGIQIGIIAHGDYCDYKVSYLMETMDLCRDEKKLVAFVNKVTDTMGGDFPEAYEYVLEQAQTCLSWRPGSSRAIVMIGDAPPHEPAQVLKQMKQYKVPRPRAINWKTELKGLSAMNVRVHGVKANNAMGEKFFDTIASESGGRVVNLDSFDIITDMFLAMCYKEGGDDLYEAYKKEVMSEGRFDARMATMFGEIDM